ncbi:hypothetical protein [Collimonas sp. OK412]|jgi:hypothetical protein|uniref:hypothetical protein n=1 Tax=Collimonas sp. (strain OK412) TaxID=1801619 RepID=UPI001C31B43E|nr:hypothetical protein [Collimonas sp. OK412]
MIVTLTAKPVPINRPPHKKDELPFCGRSAKKVQEDNGKPKKSCGICFSHSQNPAMPAIKAALLYIMQTAQSCLLQPFFPFHFCYSSVLICQPPRESITRPAAAVSV